jgi:membrane protein DedA with SNARE-associated domain
LNQNMKVAFNISLLYETCILLLLLSPSILVLPSAGVLACNESQRLHAASNILSMTKLTLI